MKLKRVGFVDHGRTDYNLDVDRMEFEVEDRRYVVTEDHEGYIRVRKSDDGSGNGYVSLKPGCSNEILIK